MVDPGHYCSDLVALPGSSLHYSLLFEPPPIRKSVIAAHALAETLREVVTAASEPELGLRKLGWWTEELNRVQTGEARHPVTQSLDQLQATGALAPAFTAMLGATEIAINEGGFASQMEMEHYSQALGGQVCRFEQLICTGHEEPGGADARLGKALDMFQVFRPAAGSPLELAWMIPGELLARHGVRESNLTDNANEALLGQALRELGLRIAGLLSADDNATGLSQSLRARARMAQLSLRAMDKVHYQLLDRPVGISPLRKLWISLRTPRRTM